MENSRKMIDFGKLWKRIDAKLMGRPMPLTYLQSIELFLGRYLEWSFIRNIVKRNGNDDWNRDWHYEQEPVLARFGINLMKYDYRFVDMDIFQVYKLTDKQYNENPSLKFYRNHPDKARISRYDRQRKINSIMVLSLQFLNLALVVISALWNELDRFVDLSPFNCNANLVAKEYSPSLFHYIFPDSAAYKTGPMPPEVVRALKEQSLFATILCWGYNTSNIYKLNFQARIFFILFLLYFILGRKVNYFKSDYMFPNSDCAELRFITEPRMEIDRIDRFIRDKLNTLEHSLGTYRSNITHMFRERGISYQRLHSHTNSLSIPAQTIRELPDVMLDENASSMRISSSGSSTATSSSYKSAAGQSKPAAYFDDLDFIWHPDDGRPASSRRISTQSTYKTSSGQPIKFKFNHQISEQDESENDELDELDEMTGSSHVHGNHHQGQCKNLTRQEYELLMQMADQSRRQLKEMQMNIYRLRPHIYDENWHLTMKYVTLQTMVFFSFAYDLVLLLIFIAYIIALMIFQCERITLCPNSITWELVFVSILVFTHGYTCIETISVGIKMISILVPCITYNMQTAEYHVRNSIRALRAILERSEQSAARSPNGTSSSSSSSNLTKSVNNTTTDDHHDLASTFASYANYVKMNQTHKHDHFGFDDDELDDDLHHHSVKNTIPAMKPLELFSNRPLNELDKVNEYALARLEADRIMFQAFLRLFVCLFELRRAAQAMTDMCRVPISSFYMVIMQAIISEASGLITVRWINIIMMGGCWFGGNVLGVCCAHFSSRVQKMERLIWSLMSADICLSKNRARFVDRPFSSELWSRLVFGFNHCRNLYSPRPFGVDLTYHKILEQNFLILSVASIFFKRPEEAEL